jgi:hypothetical protein
MLIRRPLWRRHSPQRPGEIPTMVAFLFSGLQGNVPAVGQSIADQLKPFALRIMRCRWAKRSMPSSELWMLRIVRLAILSIHHCG